LLIDLRDHRAPPRVELRQVRVELLDGADRHFVRTLRCLFAVPRDERDRRAFREQADHCLNYRQRELQLISDVLRWVVGRQRFLRRGSVRFRVAHLCWILATDTKVQRIRSQV
jgi:hypothetical protein